MWPMDLSQKLARVLPGYTGTNRSETITKLIRRFDDTLLGRRTPEPETLTQVCAFLGVCMEEDLDIILGQCSPLESQGLLERLCDIVLASEYFDEIQPLFSVDCISSECELFPKSVSRQWDSELEFSSCRDIQEEIERLSLLVEEVPEKKKKYEGDYSEVLAGLSLLKREGAAFKQVYDTDLAVWMELETSSVATEAPGLVDALTKDQKRIAESIEGLRKIIGFVEQEWEVKQPSENDRAMLEDWIVLLKDAIALRSS